MGAPISSWPLQCGFTPGGAIRPGHFWSRARGHVVNVQQSQTASKSGKAGTSPQQ